MALVVCNGARNLFLADVLAARITGAHLCLYKSTHAPVVGDTAATFTAIESTFTGYARITLTTWSAPAIDAQGNSESDETARTFTVTGAGAEHVYGYFVLDVAGNLLFAESDPSAPIDMTTVGRTYTVTPHFYLGGLSGPPFLRPKVNRMRALASKQKPSPAEQAELRQILQEL